MIRDPLSELAVSRETLELLENFIILLKKWNPAINLVSRASLVDAWNRHILDSVQLFAHGHQYARHWVDLGSGGGFPGIVIAILAADLNPIMKVTLVEADKRKAAFLRQTCQALGIKAEILPQRIEILKPLIADVLSARALASLPLLCKYAKQHLAPDGIALFPKGANYAVEIVEARKLWNLDLDIITSFTEPEAVILKMRGLPRE